VSAHLDRERASALLRADRLDGLLLLSPENFYYATGVSSMLFELYRRAPMAAALVPAGPGARLSILVNSCDVAATMRLRSQDAVYGYSVFMAEGEPVVREDGIPSSPISLPLTGDLPEQYDRREIARLIAGMLAAAGLGRSRIGIDLDFCDVNTFAILQGANPDVEFVDATSIMVGLRAVKCGAEIDALRDACALTDAGIAAAVAQVTVGTTAAEIAERFHGGVWSLARERGLSDAVGTILGRPELGGPGTARGCRQVQQAGSTIKFDVQVQAARYFSDVGRTFVLGEPSAAQLRVSALIQEAQACAREAIRPGARMCDVFRASRGPLEKAGMGNRKRGHCGHSVGLDPSIEEPPFLAPGETRPLQPGMVLAVEVGWSEPGVGLFHVEDTCLVTEDGREDLSKLPRGLCSVPSGSVR
jgi:Xaa-Pro dipeptidase